MKNVLAFLPLLSYAFVLNGQIAARLTTSPTHLPEIEIRNNSTSSLAAFAVTMAPVPQEAENRAPLVVFVDVAVDETAAPLLSTQEYKVPVPTRLRPAHLGAILTDKRRPGQPAEDLFLPPIVTAGVFDDGSTAGDSALLRRLLLRRANMLQAIEVARDMLFDAGTHNMPRIQLIKQFRNMAESLNHWYLPPEQQVGRGVYQSIVGKLMKLPEVGIGLPFPPTAFVEGETAALNRQRTKLLESQPNLTTLTRP